MSDDDFPGWLADPRLPTDQPFTAAQANQLGVRGNALARMVRDGSLRRVFRGVYVDASVPDSIDQRARALALAVPEFAVVTDTTAAWLYGVDLRTADEYLSDTQLHYFRHPDHTRVRRAGVQGGRRGMLESDIRRVGEVFATTPLRTACDLGRLQWRARALGGLDALLRLGEFDRDQLVAEVERFAGYRGVVQLRWLAPLADPRAESVRESGLRLLWLDAGLPAPELQIPVTAGGADYRLDLGDPVVKYAAEFDGQEWHSTAQQVDYDLRRRDAIRREGWVLDVFTSEDLHDWRSIETLRRGHRYATARAEVLARKGRRDDDTPQILRIW